MSLVNRLIKEAKQKPECVWINANQVGTVVEHCLATIACYGGIISREKLYEVVRAGEVSLAGVPIRVRGTTLTEPVSADSA